MVVVISIILGYIPAGYGAYPNIVGILLGWVACGLFVMLVCVPVLSPIGRWDFVLKLSTSTCYRSDREELDKLAADCTKKAGDDAAPPEEKAVVPNEEEPKIAEEKSM